MPTLLGLDPKLVICVKVDAGIDDIPGPDGDVPVEDGAEGVVAVGVGGAEPG